MKILLTGAAGFIGYHTSLNLLARGHEIVGLDNLNDYYDVTLKEARLDRLNRQSGFRFVKLDLADDGGMKDLFAREKFQRVVHLAAQAGVRYSLENPHSYVRSNVTGTLNVLEGCRHNGVEHLVYASTSSVYGANTDMPFSPHRIADHPLSHLCRHQALERADGAYLLLALQAAHHGTAVLHRLRSLGAARTWRSFCSRATSSRAGRSTSSTTDIIGATSPTSRTSPRVSRVPASSVAQPSPAWDSGSPDPATSRAPFRIYNIGNHQPVELMRYIEVIEECLGRKAEKRFLPLQPGDVPETFADIDDLVAGCRLPAGDAGRGRGAAVRRLVLRVLRFQKVSIDPGGYNAGFLWPQVCP